MISQTIFNKFSSRRTVATAARLCLYGALAFIVLLSASCKNREEQKTENEVYQADKLYAPDTVYTKVRKQIKENPNDADAWYHLADLYDRNGQYEQSIEAFKKVVELEPDRGYAYFKMGTAYNRLGKADEAVKSHLEALKYLKNNPVIYNNLGIAYGKLGKLDEEIDALKKAIEIRPRYAAARFNLGFTYLKKGDKEGAMQQYQALLELDTNAAAILNKQIKSTK